MACVVTLCLLLLLPLSWSQSTSHSGAGIHAQPPPGAHPPALPAPSSGLLRDLLRADETSHLSTKQTYAHLNKDNGKVGLFVGAAVGTVVLMAMIYCIYNKFYTKQQYLHTQLQEDPDLTFDPPEPPPPMMFFHGSAGEGRERVGGYGSLAATPSIISVAPGLSPPPAVVPFPPVYLSSHSLQTISARDLEKSFL